MKKSEKKSETVSKIGTVGGQAVIEGVMMKSRERYAVSVRMPDGTIKTSGNEFISVRKKHKILNTPFLRGIINFIEMMKLSFKTLSISAEALGIDAEAEETKFEKWLREKFGRNIMDIVMAVSMVLGLALGFGLFFFLPIWITKVIDGTVGGIGWFKNLIEGLIKIVIFIGYIWAISFMRDIRRTFQYHGAEHKTIFCYESGDELTPENAMKYSRFHPRCGTSFIFVMLALSILIYSLPFITWENALLRVLLKVLMIPVIVGVGFEFLMLTGKHSNTFTRILSAPGLWMQRLTTGEPDIDQVEIAITALKAALPAEFPQETVPESEKKEEPSVSESKINQF